MNQKHQFEGLPLPSIDLLLAHVTDYRVSFLCSGLSNIGKNHKAAKGQNVDELFGINSTRRVWRNETSIPTDEPTGGNVAAFLLKLQTSQGLLSEHDGSYSMTATQIIPRMAKGHHGKLREGRGQPSVRRGELKL